MKRVGIILLSMFSLSSIFAENDITLEWQGSDSLSYMVELKKEGIVLFKQTVTEPRIHLDLAPGTYSYQISSLNKFEKVASQTEWLSLTVIKNHIPIFSHVQSDTIYAQYEPQDIVVEAFNVMEGALFTLEQGAFTLPLEYEKTLNNSYLISLNTEALSHGKYDLRIINPSGKESYSEGAIVLKEMVAPQIDSITPNQTYINTQLPNVIVKGNYFDKDIKAFIKKGMTRIQVPVNPQSTETELSLWFNLDELPDGEYYLILINPPNQKTTVKNFFTIIDPQKIRDDVYYDRIRWGTDIMFAFPLADLFFDSGVTNFTFIEGELFAPFPEIETVLRIDLDQHHKYLQYVGWESRIAFLPILTDDYHFFTSSMGLYGRTRWNLPINLLGETTLGYRTVNLGDGDYDGYMISAGIGVLFNYDQYLLEANFRQDNWYLNGSTWVYSQQISIRLGYRFNFTR